MLRTGPRISAPLAVENYIRPPEGKIGDGQCLCYALMDKLNYDNYIYYDGEVDVDSDDSDYSTDSSDGEEDVDVLIVKQKTKYSSVSCCARSQLRPASQRTCLRVHLRAPLRAPHAVPADGLLLLWAGGSAKQRSSFIWTRP